MANANAQPNLNYPIQEAGTLLVTPSAYGCQQEYTTFYSNKKFVRGKADGWWLPWKQIDGADWSEVRN
ncbi:pyocin knob domain-containing protein, partial [Glaesserella parasuis]|uniref:pyocin knob domain-containing protein n=1 Tax=Glaesserella parasuis TaxID=738 RepID=UPI002436E1EA